MRVLLELDVPSGSPTGIIVDRFDFEPPWDGADTAEVAVNFLARQLLTALEARQASVLRLEKTSGRVTRRAQIRALRLAEGIPPNGTMPNAPGVTPRTSQKKGVKRK